jgi:hypothetical protein
MAQPASKDGTPSDRTAAAFRRLLQSSGQLNQASDILGSSVAQVDETLRSLNLGIPAKVRFHGTADEDGFVDQCLVYDKYDGRWCLLITSVSGPDGGDESDFHYEVWPFGDAPRTLRTKAIDVLPQLLETLVTLTDDATREVQSKAQQATELAQTLKSIAPARKK